MSTYVEMSLDDIIKKKKKEKLKPKKVVHQQPKKPINSMSSPKKFPIMDARNKIISKKRIQITDARDQLAALAKQKDARLKLNKLRQERAQRTGTTKIPLQQQGRYFMQNSGNQMRNAPQPRPKAFVDPSRQIAYQTPAKIHHTTYMNKHPINPKKFLETRTIGSKNKDKTINRTNRHERMPRSITRTVDNDVTMIDDDDDDPMDEDYSLPKPTLHNRKASMQLRIIAHNDAVERSSMSHRNAMSVREISPPRPPSILKKRPTVGLRNEQMLPKTEKPTLECRIIVSNLRNTVTGGDIEELFGDIGGMVESRLVRPGTAEVIYNTQEEAQKAVDLYHNRQLDGQPMNCLLVTPRLPTTMQRSTSKPALYSTNSNVEPDATTFLKVLFNNQ